MQRAAAVVSVVVAFVGVGVVASGCCCPCAYLGGVPDVAAAVRSELAPPAPLQATAPGLDAAR